MPPARHKNSDYRGYESFDEAFQVADKAASAGMNFCAQTSLVKNDESHRLERREWCEVGAGVTLFGANE